MDISKVAYFLVGAAVGAATVAVIKDGEGDNILQSIVQGGHGLTEKLLGTVETVKEDIEDYLAEAQFMHDEKIKQAAENQNMPTDPESDGNKS